MHKAAPQATERKKKKNNGHNSSSGAWERLAPAPRVTPINQIVIEKPADAEAFLEEGMTPQPSIENVVCILHRCTKEKSLAYALHLHAFMCNCGLEDHRSLGNYLVSMLVEVGSMFDAQKVFDKLEYQNECSWISLITGHIKCRKSRHALKLLQKMQEDSVYPNGYTFVALLKACAELKDSKLGSEIHAEIAENGLLKRDLFLGNTLIDMYAKCGSLAKARKVFDELPVRDVVSWTALIAGYCKHEYAEEALNCFEQMQVDGVSPNAVTFICSLKACGIMKAIDKGQHIHAEISRQGLLEKNIVMCSAVVDMYAKCGSLAKAQEVFDKLPVRNVVLWTALITGYAKHGHGREALNRFNQMQLEGICPNAYTFVCSLKACGSTGAIDKGREIHAQIARKGLLEKDHVVGNALVDMYVKCGWLAKAQEVFDKLPVRDVISWNVLMLGYAKHERGKEALNCFEQMQLEGISPDAITFVCSLKVCGSIGAIDIGRKMHARIARHGSFERDIVVGNALVDMYAKCGLLAKAQEVFEKLPVRDIASWNALIAGYVKHERSEEALSYFEQMKLEGISPNAVTFVCSLNACGSIGAIEKGIEIHAEINRKGLLEKDPVLGNALVDMYAKCGSLAKAQEVFDKLPVKDAVSWTGLIAGYAKHECGEEALKCFGQMQLEGVSPDAVTFACSLKACGSIGAADKGREIHAEIARNGLLERDLVVCKALLDMYAKCGSLATAQEVFEKLSVRDTVSWTTLIAGYAEHERGEEALTRFEQMQLEGISSDDVTFVCILKACGSIGALDKGREIHAEIARKGLLEKDLVVGNAVVDMYARCGSLAKAQEMFDKLPVRDVISWNALIAGYAQLGESESVFHTFERMREEGEKPDLITLVSVLNACSHAGLVDKGQFYFKAMTKEYGINLTLEHHTCMVDLFCRVGHLDRAVAMINKMQFHPDLVVWQVVLDACRKWGNVELGKIAFEQAVRSNERDAAAYVCMCNIFADADMQEDANEVEAMRLKKQAWKKPGHCWTDAYGIVHSFVVGDTSHSQIKNIYAKLDELSLKMQEEGYVPGLNWVSQDIYIYTSDDAKIDLLCGHSPR